jgi:hypothetical protein
MNTQTNNSTTKGKEEQKVITTPKFRMSFPHLLKPHSGFKNQEPVYSVQMLFAKTADISVLKKAAADAATKKWGSKENWPQFKHPVFKDGDLKAKKLSGYEGMLVVEARSKFKPGIVDAALDEVIDPAKIYAGRWARATVTCYAYDNQFGKGISFGLQNIQLLEDAPSFSGRKNAKDDFDAVEELSSGDDFTQSPANDGYEF